MQGDVVCNASPLIFLAKIKRLSLLDIYSLHIPSQVETEILKGLKRKREDTSLIIAYLSQRNVKPAKTTLLRDLPNFLGIGEKAVISLAVKEKIERVLIDEAKARTVARFKGLKPKGTLGILWDSYRSGRINKSQLEELTLELIEKGLSYKRRIVHRVSQKNKSLRLTLSVVNTYLSVFLKLLRFRACQSVSQQDSKLGSPCPLLRLYTFRLANLFASPLAYFCISALWRFDILTL